MVDRRRRLWPGVENVLAIGLDGGSSGDEGPESGKIGFQKIQKLEIIVRMLKMSGVMRSYEPLLKSMGEESEAM